MESANLTLLERRREGFDTFYNGLIPCLVDFVGKMGVQPCPYGVEDFCCASLRDCPCFLPRPCTRGCPHGPGRPVAFSTKGRHSTALNGSGHKIRKERDERLVSSYNSRCNILRSRCMRLTGAANFNAGPIGLAILVRAVSSRFEPNRIFVRDCRRLFFCDAVQKIGCFPVSVRQTRGGTCPAAHCLLSRTIASSRPKADSSPRR